MKDKNIKTMVYLVIGLAFLSVCSYLIYDLTYVEPVSYDTTIEIYKSDNDYRAYLKNDTNKKLVGYNLYKTVGLNLYGEEIEEIALNTDDSILNGIIIHYKSDYYSYYNLDNDKNLFKELRLRFANWNRKYIATTKGYKGQFGINYDSIYDIEGEKKVLENLNKLGESTLYFLRSNDKSYFYIDSHTCEQVNTLCNQINIYNNEGTLIYSTTNKNGYIVDFKEIPTNFNKTYDVTGYYEVSDLGIKKFNFNHQEIKSDLYDEILFVGMFNYVDYNIVYKTSDDSIYVISDDEQFMKKVTTKESNNYCIVKSNDSLHIYETACDSVNSANKYYNMNTRNHQITEVILQEEEENVEENKSN